MIMNTLVAVNINLVVAIVWVIGTSIFPYILSMDLSQNTVFDYLASDWKQFGLNTLLSVFSPLLFSLMITILLILALLKYERLVYIGVITTFLLMLVFVLIVSYLVQVPVITLALLPLGYSCYYLTRGTSV